DALRLAAARIPARYQDAVADHPQVTAWVHAIAHAARTGGPSGTRSIARGPSLLIDGSTGTGKTHQAYGAIRSLLTAGVRLTWRATTSADLHALARPRPGHDTEGPFQELVRIPLLLLDDLGAATSTPWTEELTYRLLNHRYNEQLPTLLTTNLPTDDLRTVLGDRIASRLAGMVQRVTLTGPDRRRRAA
ncbi:ATP-binding protein, partial [Streptacidiphilus griseoplanus]|uniref:ATP-binding protein n=1 Tax=Peterkaempfera griseoplana TaxID=66896 RepID=UPI0006E449EA